MSLVPFALALSGLAPLSSHRPWPRFLVDRDIWNRIGERLGAGDADLLALWAEPEQVHLAVRASDGPSPMVVSVMVERGGFPSIARYHPAASRLERTIQDLFGLQSLGLPDSRPWLDHGAWGCSAPLSAEGPRPAARRDPADYRFLPVHGEGVHQIPVGPVHAGVIEPGHFRFSANGEIVVRLEERLGYVHKGIDGLLDGADLGRAQRILARISGDSTVAYSLAFAHALEAALEIEVPQRASALRGVMAELERIANHFGDVGAVANDAAFALIHAHCGILRERVLAAADLAFGHRLMMDAVVPGGVACDLSAQGRLAILAMLDEVTPLFAKIVEVYDATPSLQDRTCRTGVLDNTLVTRWAAGGFVGRGSGRRFDARRDLAYAPYAGLKFDVPVLTAGDVDARLWVRIREAETSMRLVRELLERLPQGPVRVDVPEPTELREGIAVVEAFRGDVLVWLRVADGRVMRAHARDPSAFQWPLLEAAIEGNIVADFPLCNKSFNCSYSGHDL